MIMEAVLETEVEIVPGYRLNLPGVRYPLTHLFDKPAHIKEPSWPLRRPPKIPLGYVSGALQFICAGDGIRVKSKTKPKGEKAYIILCLCCGLVKPEKQSDFLRRTPITKANWFGVMTCGSAACARIYRQWISENAPELLPPNGQPSLHLS